MKYVWLLLYVVVLAVGIMVARVLRLSLPASMTVSVVPAFLVSYPFVKHWMPKATFAYWVTAAAISTVAGWLLYFGFQWLGA